MNFNAGTQGEALKVGRGVRDVRDANGMDLPLAWGKLVQPHGLQRDCPHGHQASGLIAFSTPLLFAIHNSIG